MEENTRRLMTACRCCCRTANTRSPGMRYRICFNRQDCWHRAYGLIIRLNCRNDQWSLNGGVEFVDCWNGGEGLDLGPTQRQKKKLEQQVNITRELVERNVENPRFHVVGGIGQLRWRW